MNIVYLTFKNRYYSSGNSYDSKTLLKIRYSGLNGLPSISKIFGNMEYKIHWSRPSGDYEVINMTME